jgi:APA family basic amino acid/polyamine antiporter
VTAITGGIVAFAAAFLPVGSLPTSPMPGTLYAFFMVAIAVMMLRKSEPIGPQVQDSGLVARRPATIAGTVFLFFNLPFEAMIVLPVWAGIGLIIYFLYGYGRATSAAGSSRCTRRRFRRSSPASPGVDDEHPRRD